MQVTLATVLHHQEHFHVVQEELEEAHRVRGRAQPHRNLDDDDDDAETGVTATEKEEEERKGREGKRGRR